MNPFRQLAAAVWIAAIVAPAVAQQRTPVETRLEARRVDVAADGKESFSSAEAAKPGDVLEYTATYRNNTDYPIANLEATLPIPAQTELVAGSVRPAKARASLDSSRFADMPLKRKAMKDGREAEEAVALSEYRALRWYPGELAPNQMLTFKARVRSRGAVNDPHVKYLTNRLAPVSLFLESRILSFAVFETANAAIDRRSS
jgi:uncharacterized repeat protein (TIGR01451 family)